MEKVFKITIDSQVYEGRGLGRREDGKAVFVPFVLPGEEVSVRPIEEKRGYILAELVSIEKPGPERIQPRCVHFGNCGGCHYQHIAYNRQLETKQEIFIEQLQRIAGLDNVMVSKIEPSENEWNYRNALQFRLNKQGELCFADIYANQPFAVRECHLPMSEIDSLWREAEFEPGVKIQRVEYRQNENGDLLMVLKGSGMELPETTSESRVSIVHLQNRDEVVLAGDEYLSMTVKDREFRVSAGSFFQTNFSTAEALVDIVLDIINSAKPQNILDVYCGVGLFSAHMAARTGSVAGIEREESACRDFIQNLDEFDNVSLFQGRAEHVLPDLPQIYDCILVDPPRSGLRKGVTQSMLAQNPDVLIYVSCNPATLARDTKHLLKAGYRLESSAIVDMFPQTFHMESVNVFRK